MRVSDVPDVPAAPPQTLLVTVSGDDRPGVTSALFDAIADVGAEVLDLEQVVVRGHLTLALLLAAGPRDEVLRSVVRDVASGLGMDVSVTAGTGDNAPRAGGRAAVVVLGAPLLASAVSAVTARIAGHGANIDRIRRLSRYPVTTVEFDISGADVADPAPRALAGVRGARGRHRGRAGGAGPSRPAPGRHGRGLDPDPGRGDRAAGRPRRPRGRGRRGDRGSHARRAGLRREPARPGGGPGRPAGGRPGRGPRGDPADPRRAHPRAHAEAAGLHRRRRLRRLPGDRRGPGARARHRPRAGQPPGGARRRADRSRGRRHRRPGREGRGVAPVRRAGAPAALAHRRDR